MCVFVSVCAFAAICTSTARLNRSVKKASDAHWIAFHASFENLNSPSRTKSMFRTISSYGLRAESVATEFCNRRICRTAHVPGLKRYFFVGFGFFRAFLRTLDGAAALFGSSAVGRTIVDLFVLCSLFQCEFIQLYAFLTIKKTN